MPNGEWYVTRREFDTAIEAADAPPIVSTMPFRLIPGPTTTDSTEDRWAIDLRLKLDRFVLGCDVCPESRPSRRRPPRWSVVARAVAAAVDAPADQVREALAAAIAAERG